MPEVAIIGCGLAGLSAAVTLSSHGYKVCLFEASQKAGGRASAFPFKLNSPPCNSQKEYYIDNGQHIMMGCYHETLTFLREIASFKNVSIQEKLEVKMVTSEGRIYLLKSGILPYPFNLLQALLGFDLLSFKQKLKAVKFVNSLKSLQIESLQNLDVKTWLEKSGQTGVLYSGMWEILCIGTLNTPPEKSSAAIFSEILKIIFLGGEDNSKIVVSEVDLSSLFVEPAINYIKSRGGTVHFSTPVHSIERVDSGCVNLHSRNEIFGKYSDVIFAVPHHALRKISGIQEFIPLSPEDNMEYSSITTFHLFLKENPLVDRFLALVGSPVQWVFNHGDYITTVTSSSSAWDTKPEEEILSVIVDELNKYLGIRQEQILTHKMIKEKRATFICGGKNLNLRASTKTNLPNVYLAGDWTTTGLPATIEGAVLSGKTAALEVISKYS